MDDIRAVRVGGLRPNNFDLIRLAAALQVVLIHAFENLGLPVPDWVAWTSIFPGVPIFFVLSGFLISLSYERNPHLGQFAVNRLLRIFPALWVCFLLSVASVLLIRSELLTTAQPLAIAGWVAAQVSMGQVYQPAFLRDYGVGALNGSLWTIPVELQFYLLVPILYAGGGLLRRRGRGMLSLLVVCLLINRGFAAWKLSGDSLGMKLFGATFLPHVWYFLAGILVQRHFARLQSLLSGRAGWWLALHVVTCTVLSPLGWQVKGNLIGPLPSLTLIGLTFSLAYTRPGLSDRLLRHNDISYGTYLYHMVIVNALLELQWPRTPGTVVAVFALTLVCAGLSWKLVEEPALACKGFLRRPALPAFEFPAAVMVQPSATDEPLTNRVASNPAATESTRVENASA